MAGLLAAVAVLLGVPAVASATLPGTNGLVWKRYQSGALETYDLATKVTQQTNIADVSFSPDASHVAFVSQFGYPGPFGGTAFAQHVSVLPMTGGVPVDLTPDSRDSNYDPTFCGDGTVVFIRQSASGAGKVYRTLWAVGPAGGAPRQIDAGGTPPAAGDQQDKGSDDQPSCSKDGTVVFHRSLGDYYGGQLWKVNVNGGAPTMIYDNSKGSTRPYPDVSPDGISIVFTGPATPSGGLGVVTMPIDGGTPQPVAGVGKFAGTASWSPDGKQLLYPRVVATTVGPSGFPTASDVRLFTLDIASAVETDQGALPTNQPVSLVWSPSKLTPKIGTAPTYTVPTPTPTPTPGTGQPSQAAVLAALKALGLPAAATKLANLLAKGGVAVSFAAPSAGTLNVAWSVIGLGARAAATKGTTIAAATKTVASAGRTKVTIKLTKAGMKALKKAKRAKRAVKVTSRAAFTPTGGARTVATAHFKLKK